MLNRWGIKNWVLVLALVPTIIITLMLGTYFTLTRFKELEENITNYGTVLALRLSPFACNPIMSHDTKELMSIAKNALEEPEIYNVSFFDVYGNKIYQSGSSQLNIEIPANKKNFIDPILIVENGHLFAFVAPVFQKDSRHIELLDSNPKGQLVGWICLEMNTAATSLHEYQLIIYNLFILMVGLLISGLVGSRIGEKVTEPVLALTRTVESIKQGELRARSNSHATWELKILQDGVNDMANSLQLAHEIMQNNINKATKDLRKTLETIEFQNNELKTARRESELANQAKTKFLANMSHELRTPLNGVLGFVGRIEKTNLNNKQQEYLSYIRKSATHLLQIINEILDFSKIEAGKIDLHISKFNLVEVIEDSLFMLAPSAHDKKIEIIPIIYQDVPSIVESDSLKIRQILTNLVSNSIKFTENGKIIVRVMVEDENDSQLKIAISISDTGIGISKEQQQKLFQAFTQLSSDPTHKINGTGLGLVICKNLTEVIGGNISFKSNYGEGTTFEFNFPTSKSGTASECVNNKLDNKKILILEDDDICKSSLKHILSEWGATVFTKHEENLTYDLVLTSLKHQIDNFYELQNSVKSKFYGVMQNSTSHSAHKRVLKSGYDFSVAKPIIRKRLLEEILQTLNYQSKNTRSVLKKNLKILAIDDNKDNLKLLASILSENNINYAEANSGKDAVEVFKQSQFDLVLMDINMPDIDGIQATKLIREWELKNRDCRTPIIALTAYYKADESNEFHNVGIDDFTFKPIDENQLKAVIHKWTKSKIVLKKSTTNDIVAELKIKFLDELPKNVARFEKMLAEKNYQGLKNAIHKQHGAVLYLHMPELANLFKYAEHALSTNTSETEIKLHVENLLQGCYASITTKATA